MHAYEPKGMRLADGWDEDEVRRPATNRRMGGSQVEDGAAEAECGVARKGKGRGRDVVVGVEGRGRKG